MQRIGNIHGIHVSIFMFNFKTHTNKFSPSYGLNCISPYPTTTAFLAHQLISSLSLLYKNSIFNFSAFVPVASLIKHACLFIFLPQQFYLLLNLFYYWELKRVFTLTYEARKRNWVHDMKSFGCCCLQPIVIKAIGSLSQRVVTLLTVSQEDSNNSGSNVNNLGTKLRGNYDSSGARRSGHKLGKQQNQISRRDDFERPLKY